MNTTTVATTDIVPIIPGTPFQGGFYAGRFCVNDQQFALIVAPKNGGEQEDILWSEKYTDISGARSFCDGIANTNAMVEADLALGKWARELSINGFTDWYLPSRDELELCYRYLKPTTQKNWTWRNGENPSALPVATYPYTEIDPAQTPADVFRDDGVEAFEPVWYWTSTQCSADTAWSQNFDDGDQDSNGKGYELRARAVRRFLII